MAMGQNWVSRKPYWQRRDMFSKKDVKLWAWKGGRFVLIFEPLPDGHVFFSNVLAKLPQTRLLPQEALESFILQKLMPLAGRER